MLVINGVKIGAAHIDKGVFAFLSAQANTTCTNAGDWYPINGTFTNAPMKDFVFDTDHIEYSGIATTWFLIQYHATFQSDRSLTTAHLAVEKNGSAVDASIMGQYLKTKDEPFMASGMAAVQLSTNDEIQLLVKSDGAGDVLTFIHYTTAITEMFN